MYMSVGDVYMSMGDVRVRVRVNELPLVGSHLHY